MSGSRGRSLRLLYARNLFAPADLGGNRYPFEVTRRLVQRGHDVRVVTTGAWSEDSWIPLHRYRVSNRNPLLTFWTHAIAGRVAMSRTMRGWRPDIVVLSSYDLAFGYHWPWQIAPDIPTAFIYHSRFHSDAVQRVLSGSSWPQKLVAPPLRRFVRAVQAIPLVRCTALVAVSPFSRREIENYVPRSDVHVITTGVDTDHFRPGDQMPARERLGLPPDATVLLTVGRLVPVKRYDRAIECLSLLLKSEPRRWRLLIVGAGPEEERLRALANDRGVESAVRFEGHLVGDELLTRYRAADLQLCTSEFENWSLSLLEGLACAVPVLGTPAGGTPDLLAPIDPSLVLPSGEPEDIARTVRTFVADAERVRRVSRLARRAAEAYSWDRVVKQLETLLLEVSANSIRRRPTPL